jgi:hypothetical protein
MFFNLQKDYLYIFDEVLFVLLKGLGVSVNRNDHRDSFSWKNVCSIFLSTQCLINVH